MEQICRICGNCRYFNAYYVKGVSKFEKQKIGRCALFEKTLDKYGQCSAWQSDSERLQTQKTVVTKELSELSEQMATLKQILDETEK